MKEQNNIKRDTSCMKLKVYLLLTSFYPLWVQLRYRQYECLLHLILVDVMQNAIML